VGMETLGGVRRGAAGVAGECGRGVGVGVPPEKREI